MSTDAKRLRGGKRTGAGRPLIGIVQVSLQLSPADLTTAELLGNGNRSAGVRLALADARRGLLTAVKVMAIQHETAVLPQRSGRPLLDAPSAPACE